MAHVKTAVSTTLGPFYFTLYGCASRETHFQRSFIHVYLTNCTGRFNVLSPPHLTSVT